MKSADHLNLELWEDEALIRQQNQLKYQFWELLGKVGDQIEQQDLLKIHARSKGKKLSQGSDLMGLPYQVLDIVRDFDLASGLNIRVLNWYGKGLYLLVLLGKEKFGSLDLKGLSFFQTYWESPWDYERLVETEPTSAKQPCEKEPDFLQWCKKIPVSHLVTENESEWVFQLKKLLERISRHLGIQEN